MSFYEPEVFTPDQATYQKAHRILQPIWEWIKEGREPALRSALFPPLLAVVFYMSVVGILTVIDIVVQSEIISPFSKWMVSMKFQKDKKFTKEMAVNALRNAFWNHLLWIFPMAFVQLIWVPPSPLPDVAPTLFDFVWQQVLFFFMFDFEYWAFHAIHHKVRPLYRWCHSIHHQYHAPFALVTQYLHPWELLFVGLGISCTPWVIKPHIMTYWSWFIVANYVSIEVHCGYDFPWAAHNWIPIYGGAPAHDMHHMRPMSNYGPWLVWLDQLCGWRLTHKQLEEMKMERNEKEKFLGLQADEDTKGLEIWN